MQKFNFSEIAYFSQKVHEQVYEYRRTNSDLTFKLSKHFGEIVDKDKGGTETTWKIKTKTVSTNKPQT